MKKLVVFVFIIFSVAISYITGSEKENKAINSLIEFNRIEKNFIEKYYNRKWFSSPDRFWTAGIILTSIGSEFFGTGLIFMIMFATNYSERIYYEYEYESYRKYIKREIKEIKYPLHSLILGVTLIQVGAILAILSAIPFWFVYMIKTIDKKRMAFFDRMNLNIGVVVMGDNIFDRYENRLNISMTITL